MSKVDRAKATIPLLKEVEEEAEVGHFKEVEAILIEVLLIMVEAEVLPTMVVKEVGELASEMLLLTILASALKCIEVEEATEEEEVEATPSPKLLLLTPQTSSNMDQNPTLVLSSTLLR